MHQLWSSQKVCVGEKVTQATKMICNRCSSIPLELFLGNRSIQYPLHHSLADFVVSAWRGCHSCSLLLQQRKSQFCPLGLGPPNLNPRFDGDSYWVEWDHAEDRIVLASGMNHYFLEYDSETDLRTRGKRIRMLSYKHVNSQRVHSRPIRSIKH